MQLTSTFSLGFDRPSSAYDLETMEHFPPIASALVELPQEKRALILHSIFLLLASLEHYNAYTRALLLYITSSLDLPLGVLVAEEKRLARGLSGNILSSLAPEELAQKRADEVKASGSRRGRAGSARAVDFITLAPTLADENLGCVLGLSIGQSAAASCLGSLSKSQVIPSTLFGLNGARPGAKTIQNCTRDIQDFAFIPLNGSKKDQYTDGRNTVADDRRMRIVICIDGWHEAAPNTTLNSSFSVPPKCWDVIGNDSEAFVMNWEAESLYKVYVALETVIRSEAWKAAKDEIMNISCMFEPLGGQLESSSGIDSNKYSQGAVVIPSGAQLNHSNRIPQATKDGTVASSSGLININFSAPMAPAASNGGSTIEDLVEDSEIIVDGTNVLQVARVLKEQTWPCNLRKVSKLVDNEWNIGMVRADKAGAALADVIINRGFGERAISLIGYSLGARVIYTCLMILAERRIFGMVESVVMIGTPAPADSRVWCALRTVIAGRIVNVFSRDDYMLAFLSRTTVTQFGLAGLESIENAHGVENLDISHMVRGHLRYQKLVSAILRMIRWEDVFIKKVSENDCAVAVRDELHTNSLIADKNSQYGLATKFKPSSSVETKFCEVIKKELSTRIGKARGKTKKQACLEVANTSRPLPNVLMPVQTNRPPSKPARQPDNNNMYTNSRNRTSTRMTQPRSHGHSFTPTLMNAREQGLQLGGAGNQQPQGELQDTTKPILGRSESSKKPISASSRESDNGSISFAPSDQRSTIHGRGGRRSDRGGRFRGGGKKRPADHEGRVRAITGNNHHC